tara:strand:- start:35 stop:676 length:642 start_codon:yes stop_codon:yes gene_type:complete
MKTPFSITGITQSDFTRRIKQAYSQVSGSPVGMKVVDRFMDALFKENPGEPKMSRPLIGQCFMIQPPKPAEPDIYELSFTDRSDDQNHELSTNLAGNRKALRRLFNSAFLTAVGERFDVSNLDDYNSITSFVETRALESAKAEGLDYYDDSVIEPRVNAQLSEWAKKDSLSLADELFDMWFDTVHEGHIHELVDEVTNGMMEINYAMAQIDFD